VNAKDADTARLHDLARRAERTGEPQFSCFLDPALAGAARIAARQCNVSVAFDGGYPDAERQIAAFHIGDAPEEWPIDCVRMRWNEKYGAPGHRDLLGALMGLGFERERMGDIALGSGEAYVFASPNMADYLARSLDSAGRTALICTLVDGAPDLPPLQGRALRETVASLRLDAVLAAGFDLGRAEAQRLIRQRLVRKNHVEEDHPDADVGEGDLISARGLGRVKIEKVLGETKKGRIAIQLFKFGV